MPALNLPAPTQQRDEDGAALPATAPAVILPPPEIKSIVDKTAAFIAKNANPALEQRLREREKTDSRFAFMNPADAYHAYYKQRVNDVRAGNVGSPAPDGTATETKSTADAVVDSATGSAQEAAGDAAEAGKPVEPPSLEFLADLPPNIQAVDLDIIRLTALFTARSGRRFTTDLGTREARNPQFDFLRPTHSLFGYFNRLVEQYTKILVPSKELHNQLDRRSGKAAAAGEDSAVAAKRVILTDARERAEWEKWQTSKRKEMEDEAEKERIAFAEIDWQDFIVATEITFNEADEAGLNELPPPMSLRDVENMTITQKKMAAMIMEGRQDEVQELEREQQAQPAGADVGSELPQGRAAAEHAAAEVQPADPNAPMLKVRKDYVPKAKRQQAKDQPAMVKVGDQQIPIDQFSEHMRIELLDPRWKEQQRQSEANRSASNLLPGGTDVSASFRALAAHRADIFGTSADDEARKMIEAEIKAKQREREKNVWDGHTASMDSTRERYQANANLDDQIAALHRAKGLTGDEQASAIGPSMAGDNVEGDSAPQFLPSAAGGATISGAPQPQGSSFTPASGMPSHQAYESLEPQMGAAPSVSGVTRAAEDEAEGQPAPKRMRMPKPADGSLIPEHEWLEQVPGPISINIQLPSVPDKPEWGCDGSTLTLPEVPLTALAGTLRDRIMQKIGLPPGKQRLQYNGKMVANSISLAGLNMDDGDSMVLAVREDKKKK